MTVPSVERPGEPGHFCVKSAGHGYRTHACGCGPWPIKGQISTTPTGIPIIDCDTCGHRHPVSRDHCPKCGMAHLFDCQPSTPTDYDTDLFGGVA